MKKNSRKIVIKLKRKNNKARITISVKNLTMEETIMAYNALEERIEMLLDENIQKLTQEILNESEEGK